MANVVNPGHLGIGPFGHWAKSWRSPASNIGQYSWLITIKNGASHPMVI